MTHDMLEYLPRQLVVTPKPQHGESYMGFVLRTSEANGYPSINIILRHSGMTDNEMRSARPPLEKLAPLFGRAVEYFAALGEPRTTNGRLLPLMNQPLSAIYLRSKHARVCPECVRENGYVHAFWELRHAVACPRHHRMALSQCPQCHREIDWWRRGLTVCSCGHDFSSDRGDKFENVAVQVLLEVMQAKLMGNQLDTSALEYVGFPVDGIKGMSLATLLGLLHRLEKFMPPFDNTSSTSGEWLALEATAEMFSAWPQGFHCYLDRVHGPQANMRANGLRGQFGSFYESLFKQGLPKEEIAFMRQAFADFGEQHWKKASIHPRLSSGKESNIVGIEGLAKAIGVRPVTARKLVAKGLIPAHAQNHRSGRQLFDLSQQMPFEFAEGKSLSLEAAARILDIPAAILRAYRMRGYYVPRHLASPATLYHEQDVEALRSDLVRGCGKIPIIDELRYTTLRRVMMKKLGPSEVKAEFIDAVRKREIQSLGIAGNQPGDLVLDAREVKRFLEQIVEKVSGTASIEHAQRELDVDSTVITALIKGGMLHAISTDLGVRIEESSLNRFSSQFVSCRRLAKLKGMAQQEVIDLCKELQFGLLAMDGKGRTTSNTFIERCQIPLLGIGRMQYINLPAAA